MFTSLVGNHLNLPDSYNCPLQLWMMLKSIYWGTYSAVSLPHHCSQKKKSPLAIS